MSTDFKSQPQLVSWLMHLLRQVKQVITRMEQRIMACATSGSVTATRQTLAQRAMGMEMALVDIPIVTYQPSGPIQLQHAILHASWYFHQSIWENLLRLVFLRLRLFLRLVVLGRRITHRDNSNHYYHSTSHDDFENRRFEL